MRNPLAFLLILPALTASTALAGSISNLAIVKGIGLSSVGGTFAAGGSFSGTFLIDGSNLPSGDGVVTLPSPVDVATTQDTGNIYAGITYTSGQLKVAGVFSPPTGPPTTEYELVLTGQNNSNNIFGELDLYFLQVTGTFVGGQILEADEFVGASANIKSGNFLERIDGSGDAIAIDPSPAPTPEPSSWATGAAGILAISTWIRRRAPKN